MLTVQRGLKVMRSFGSSKIVLGNVDLVRRTGIPKASVSRITSTLVGLGMLGRPPNGRQFQVGTRALGLGRAYLDVSPIHASAYPIMQELADQLDMSIA